MVRINRIQIWFYATYLFSIYGSGTEYTVRYASAVPVPYQILIFLNGDTYCTVTYLPYLAGFLHLYKT